MLIICIIIYKAVCKNILFKYSYSFRTTILRLKFSFPGSQK